MRVLTVKITLLLFQHLPFIYQEVAHVFSVLTAFKPVKFNFMLQTRDMLVFVAPFRKEEIILRRTLAKSVEKTKLQN